jgi:hypothetical protein
MFIVRYLVSKNTCPLLMTFQLKTSLILSMTVLRNKLSIFKIFIQVWNFSSHQSTSPVTGCNDLIPAPTAGNIVQIFNGKIFKVSPVILVEPLEHQQNASLSNPDSSQGTKKSYKE